MRRVGTCAAAAALVLLSGCRDKTRQGAVVERTVDEVMGTRVQVKVWTDGDPASVQRAERGIEEALSRAREVHGRMSPWDPDSAVSRVNAAAGAEAVVVDEWTFRVLEESLEVSRLTGGAFDPSWAALQGLWDFRAERPTVPPASDVARRLPLVDHRLVRLDPAARSVRLAREGMRIDLGGAAKGFALDRMAAALRHLGIGDFICYAGGDLLVAGRHGERPWRLGIQDPRERGALVARYETDRPVAVVTSGDYERYFELDATRYHHILDPATGMPARGVMSVTLFAPTGLRADALSTGVFVLGRREGLSLVEALEDVEAVVIDAQGRIHVSSGMRGSVERVGRVGPG
jgi:thiamine biosynthesis lipoprotein